jgi:hypothetical protein
VRDSSSVSLTFEIHVRPGARRAKVGGSHDGALAIAVTAPPADGKANEAVCAAVADAFGVRTSAVQLVRGHTSRRKAVTVELDEHDARVRLTELLDG